MTPITSSTSATEPGTVAQPVAPRSQPPPAEPAVAHLERGEPGEHVEVDREGLAALEPLVDAEERHPTKV